jgi:hypothetical protein
MLGMPRFRHLPITRHTSFVTSLQHEGRTIRNGFARYRRGDGKNYDFLDYITDNFRFSYGQYWDPGRDIRSAIERDRAMIASGKIEWSTLIADGESIAMKIERGPDLVRQEQQHHRQMFH